MKVLVVIKKSPAQRYVINLYTKKLVDDVKDLIWSCKHSQAIAMVFEKGDLERQISKNEIHEVEADLILTECAASWDLTK